MDLLIQNVLPVNLVILKNLEQISVYNVQMELTEIQLLTNVNLVMPNVLYVLEKIGLNVQSVLTDFS